MFISKLSIDRPIMISMGLVVFLLFGFLAYFTLPLNTMPDVELGYVSIQTVYPGAGPREIETQITKKIEDAVGTISKIDWIKSYSMEGASIIIIKFLLGKDPNIANQEIKDKVNAILSQLPRDAELPVIEKFDFSAIPIMDIILTGTVGTRELYEVADKRLKDRLSQVDGVAKVDITGGQEREIRVELDNRIVVENSLSLIQLSQILAAHNLDLPGGHFIEGSQEYTVRMKGEYNRVEEIENLDVPTPFGIKKMGRLASVKDSASEARERTIYYDKATQIREDNAILLSIVKSSDGNAVQMSAQIRRLLPSLKENLPPGCALNVVRDDSEFTKSSVDDTISNIIMGIFLTGLVLLFFLHDLRSTIIVALAMPMSILSTFMLMQVSGFSLNIMTLMGLSTSVGILVTNSVVVLENIFRHKEMGHRRRIAADRGTAEIAVAVLASTLTNIVVFLPIASMTSLVGQFFKEFALTVTYATIFSLLISFTLTPMLASLILPDVDKKKHPLGKRLEGIFHQWESVYKKALGAIVRKKRYAFLVVAAAVIAFILSLFVAGKVGFEFMPTLDEGNLTIEVELPQGYQIDVTAKLLQEMETRVSNYPEVKHIITTLGSISDLDVGTNMARMQVKLVEAQKRERSSESMANLLIQKFSDIPNAKIRVSALAQGGSGEAPLQFSLMGQDLDRLELYKADVVERIKDIPGLINLNTSSRPGKPELVLTPDRRKLAEVGITVYEIAMTLRAAVEGLIATRYRESGNEYDIRILYQEESVSSPEQIADLSVATPQGMMRLSQLATITFANGFSQILRKDKAKTIDISGYTAPGYPLGDVVNVVKNRLSDIQFEEGYKIDWGGDVQMMQETISDMLRTFLIAFILTYMLLAAILESLTQPFMIMGTVPLALIGVFLALYVTGKTMNTISMMAIIMLIGIVVNNAILLLDYTNQLRRDGKDVVSALVEACPTKLKAILMSTVAIVLGMLPMALGMGAAGKEFRQPMGIVSIGGLIVSAFLTLFVIPALYRLTTKQIKETVHESDH